MTWVESRYAPKTDVEKLWHAGRVRGGVVHDRRRPSENIAAVLGAVAAHGPVHGGEIARQSGQNQANVAVWLRKLDRFGFIEHLQERPQLGHQGGGRPAVLWQITAAGKELLNALTTDNQENRNGV